MGDTTTSTLVLFDQLTAPRPIICRTTLLHDPNPEGVCRDCGIEVPDGTQVAGTCLSTEYPVRWNAPVRPADRISFWRRNR